MVYKIKSIRNNEESLTFRAMNAVKDYIQKNNLLKGDKLPSERELGELLGVSRVVVREALKLLETLGLVKKLQGKGTYVGELKINILSRNVWQSLDKSNLNIIEVLEVRREFEKSIIKLAIEKVNDSDLQELKNIIDKMKIEKNRIRYVEQDLNFHLKFLGILKNEFIKKLSSILIDFFMFFIILDDSKKYLNVNYRTYSVRFHEEILDGLRKRDLKKVLDSMDDHFSSMRKELE